MGAASQELTERAKLLISERRYQEAVRACRRALLSQPGQVEIRLLLGEALLAMERYDEVRVEMLALARKAPDRAAVHRLLGEAYLRDGRPQPAIEALRKALKLDPGDEVAEELIAEAADESAPVSHTIERWFADEVEPTVETQSPEWEEAHTPVPAATSADAQVAKEPSVQVDPSLVEEALTASVEVPPDSPVRGTEPKYPRPFSRPKKPVAPSRFPPRPGAPLASREAPAAPLTRQLKPKAARPAPSPSGLPSRPAGVPAQAPFPDAPTTTHPSPSTFPPPPGAPLRSPRGPARPLPGGGGGAPFGSPLGPSPTHAARPSALKEAPEPRTDQLSLNELDSLAPVHMMDGPPTQRRPPSDPLGPPVPYQDFVPQDLIAEHPPLDGDSSPTIAFNGGLKDPDDEPTRAIIGSDDDDLEGEPTRARVSPDLQLGEPDTHDRFAAPKYPPKYADEADTGQKNVGALADYTPAVAPSSPQLRTHRVRGKSRSWLLPVITGAIGLLVLGVVLVFGLSAWLAGSEKQEIREAAAAAGDSGSRADLEAVVARIEADDDEEMLALKARLLATLTYEHGGDHADQVRSIVNRLTAEDAVVDARIAAALIYLAQSDPDSAGEQLPRRAREGEQVAEVHRIRAFVMAARGEWADARDAAAEAVMRRPTGARHVALQALTGYKSGRYEAALTLLEGAPNYEQHASLRVTRARILAGSGSDPASAVQEASAVISELADDATPFELAWAHLVRAQHGDAAAALDEARAAAEHPPPLDEEFRMELVRVFLTYEEFEEADRQLSGLAENVPAIDARGRALLSAEVALAVGDLDRSEQALGEAGAGSRQDLLRAQLLEQQGRTAAARQFYENVMSVPGPEGRRAAVRLAGIEMAEGDTARVVELLEPRWEQAVDDLELVPLLARAYLDRNRVDDADRVVDAAVRRRPGAPALEAVRGAVLLARGEFEDALAPLRTAATALPHHAWLRADLGRAAQLAGQTDEARQAYEATLEMDAESQRALVGLAQLSFESDDFAGARERLEAVQNPRGDEALTVARLQSQLLVIEGAGQAGAETVAPLARRHRDVFVWTALGDLYTQAEQDSRATRAYETALEIDAHHPEAILGQAFMQSRAGNMSRATSLAERAEQAARRAGREGAIEPRVELVRGWIEFERGPAHYDDAIARANAAIAGDATLSSAHLLLGTVAIEQNNDPLPHLRSAVSARAPLPEALGQLAPRLPNADQDEACELGRRYLRAAPRGYDAADIRRLVGRCR